MLAAKEFPSNSPGFAMDSLRFPHFGVQTCSNISGLNDIAQVEEKKPSKRIGSMNQNTLRYVSNNPTFSIQPFRVGPGSPLSLASRSRDTLVET